MTTSALLERCRRAGVFLANRTSFEIGGEAREFYLPETREELREICLRFAEEGKSPHLLGGGCNTLFPDEPFSRPVISTERLRRLVVLGNRLRAEAGVRMDVLIRAAIESGLEGLEYFVGIPGTAGGAAAMNAGGSGHSFGDRVALVEAVDLETGEIEEIPGSQVRWGYRTSHLEGRAITAVELELSPADVGLLRRHAREFLKRKAASQPLTSASAGCIFRNPEAGGAAASLIDRAGLKGCREGGAVVSERHANFILNEKGSATARDVLALLERVRRAVEGEFGVRLETEIVIPRLS
jgi:UDP-N-acetylmuramate dehydrogenase